MATKQKQPPDRGGSSATHIMKRAFSVNLGVSRVLIRQSRPIPGSSLLKTLRRVRIGLALIHAIL
jgi:hypothetical protein